jgi:hypothetical protein
MKTTLHLLSVLFLCAFLSACHKDVSNNSIAYDIDAQRFIDSSGITDGKQKSAINTFVIQLKDSLLWTKFAAVYPMVGGTATTNKWNLKDPRDLDAAYRLTFNGTPVYTNTGILFPTISDYADTHLADSTLAYNNNSISYYSRTQNTINGYDMGCSDFTSPYNEFAIYHSSNVTDYFGYYAYGQTPANTKGLFMLSATMSDVKRYENGVVTDSKGSGPTSVFTDLPVLIGKVSNASVGGQKECALATIGEGLTDAQVLTFYNIVQNFETAIARNYD